MINKSIIILLSAVLAGGCASSQKAAKAATAEFQVKGICSMCENRIEQAALIPGVRLAEWNQETDVLKVIYAPSKVKLDDIHQSIANAGHDTDKIKAPDEAYAKLPGCCAYRDGVEKH